MAIVNSIVQSESVGGKVDVWSEENVGTEIRVTFSAETSEDEPPAHSDMAPFKFDDPMHPPSVSLVGFELEHKGVELLYSVLRTYLVSWWGFSIQPPDLGYGHIVILDDDPSLVVAATKERDTSRPFIILSSSRGSPQIMTIASDHELIGGFCRIVYKPGGPSRLCAVLKLCMHVLKIGWKQCPTRVQTLTQSRDESGQTKNAKPGIATTHFPRRNSDERYPLLRPIMGSRSTSAPSTPWSALSPTAEKDDELSVLPASNSNQSFVTPTVSVGSGGTLLKSSVGTIDATEHRFRVLVVEDNSILRNLLYVPTAVSPQEILIFFHSVKWLKTKVCRSSAGAATYAH